MECVGDIAADGGDGNSGNMHRTTVPPCRSDVQGEAGMATAPSVNFAPSANDMVVSPARGICHDAAANRAANRDVLVTVQAAQVAVSPQSVAEAFSPIASGPMGPATSADAPNVFPLAPPAVDCPAVATVKPAMSALFATVCLDAACLVLEWCSDEELLVLGQTGHMLRRILAAHDAALWKPRCERLWHGKQVYAEALHVAALSTLATGVPDSPGDTLPRPIVAALLRATAVETPPDGLLHGLARSWRAAFFVSRRDARRDFLSEEELFQLEWRVDFAAAAAGSAESPPSSPGAATANSSRIFRRVGRVKLVQPIPSMPAVPCQLLAGGRAFQVDVFPAHRVRRDPDTWGWRITNAHVTFQTVSGAGVDAQTTGFDRVAGSHSSDGGSMSSPRSPATAAGATVSHTLHVEEADPVESLLRRSRAALRLRSPPPPSDGPQTPVLSSEPQLREADENPSGSIGILLQGSAMRVVPDRISSIAAE